MKNIVNVISLIILCVALLGFMPVSVNAQDDCFSIIEHYSYYGDWNTEDRTDDDNNTYQLVIPPYWFDSWLMKNAYIYPKFDKYDKRVDLYRESFISGILQGELTIRLNSEAQGRSLIKQFAQELLDKGIPFSEETTNLLEALVKSSGSYRLDPSTIQASTEEIASHTKSVKFANTLDSLGIGLKSLSFVYNIHNDAMKDLFVHSLASANSLERIAVIDNWMSSNPPSDSAMIEGYELAKAEIVSYVDNEPTYLREVISQFDNGIIIPALDLAQSWTLFILSKVGVEIGKGLGTAVGIVTTVGMSYYDLYTEDIESFQLICAEAMVDKWLQWRIIEYDWEFYDEPTCRDARELYYQTHFVRLGLSYSAFKLHDDMFRFRWSWTGVGKLLSEIVSLRYDDVQDLRDFLNEEMTDIKDHALRYQKEYKFDVITAPQVISHVTTSINPPEIKIALSRDLDQTTVNSNCISMIGSSSGVIDFTCEFSNDNNILTITPIGTLEYEETITVTLDTCLQNEDGEGLENPYVFSFTLDNAPQVIISTWSGNNGNITEEIEFVDIGSDFTVHANPDPDFQVDKWYIDGQFEQDGGSSLTLTDILQSHSVGVTFRPTILGHINCRFPDGGELFARGAKVDIRWGFDGIIGENVIIELLDNNSPVDTISSSTRNDQFHTWDIPNNIDLSTSYKIRVSSIDDPTIFGQSPSEFEIANEVYVPPVIEIANLSELQDVLSNMGSSQFPDTAYYKLTADIDCQGQDLTPVSILFEGTFDGNSHTIYRYDMRDTTMDYMGLFSTIYRRGVVKNLNIGYDVSIRGRDYVGAIAGENLGQVINCVVGPQENQNSQVRGRHYIGGLVGENRGLIRSCRTRKSGSSQLEVIGDGTVGGISGRSGEGSGTYSNIEYCLSDCYVDSDDDYAGGITGINSDTVSECMYVGSHIQASSWGSGGIVGWNQSGLVVNCCNAGRVIGGDAFNGGIVGWLNGGRVESCLSYGPMTYSPKGGIAGNHCSGANGVFDCLWDTQATGCPEAVPMDPCNVVNSFGFPSAVFSDPSIYVDSVGWDTTNVWLIRPGQGYAYLRGIGEQLDHPLNILVSSEISSGIMISWDMIDFLSDGITLNAKYKVYRSDTTVVTDNTVELTDWISDTELLDTTAHPERNYYYSVKSASNIIGARESELSELINGYRVYPPVPSPYNVASSEDFVKSVLIEWEASDANYYKIYRTPISAIK